MSPHHDRRMSDCGDVTGVHASIVSVVTRAQNLTSGDRIERNPDWVVDRLLEEAHRAISDEYVYTAGMEAAAASEGLGPRGGRSAGHPRLVDAKPGGSQEIDRGARAVEVDELVGRETGHEFASPGRDRGDGPANVIVEALPDLGDEDRGAKAIGDRGE